MKQTVKEVLAGLPSGITAFALSELHGFDIKQIKAAIDAGDVSAKIGLLNNKPMVWLYPKKGE